MEDGLDSAYPPKPTQIAQARAAGYKAWLGYFAGPNILNGWSEQNFHDVMNGGMDTGAYCSGWADPAAMKAQAVSWGVPRIILDDESGIRSLHGDKEALKHVSLNRATARGMMHGGKPRPVLEYSPTAKLWKVSSWVQPWIDAAGSGQYGNMPVFAGVHAACYVFAAYLGYDPKTSWPPYYPPPGDGHPRAWQFQGTTSLFGMGVDLTHFDDGFFGTKPLPQGDMDMLYVSTIKSLKTSLKTFAPMTLYSDPSTSALAVGSVAAGASVSVVGYLYSNAGVQSTDLGAGAGPGIDFVWWILDNGAFGADADLVTVGVSGAPVGKVLSTLPSGMKLYYAKESELVGITGGGVTQAQVDQSISAAIGKIVFPAGVTTDQVNAAISAAIGKLPDFATKEQVAQAILEAVQGLPASKDPHHHAVLSLINTGPVIPD